MSEVVVFHHSKGLTEDVLAFAQALRARGHQVHMPDLYDGVTFATLEDGIAHAQSIGVPTILERGRRAVDGVETDITYVGFSLGVLPAQALAQKRPGPTAAALFHSCVPPEEFGSWPAGVPLQIHIMDRDPLASPPETDLETARRLDAELDEATFFSYPGDQHLFADESLPSYDAQAARAAEERVLELLS